MSLDSPDDHSVATMNGSSNMDDGLGTIDPAALSGGAVHPPTNLEPNSRGIKRERSPDGYGDYSHGDDQNDSKPRKRGRPTKTPRTSGDFTNDQSGALPTPSSQTSYEQVHTPQPKQQTTPAPPVRTPTQSSPGPRATPKSTLKALPGVRDHTSDQLGPDGAEFIAREIDEAGEQKVDENGNLKGGREYKMRTFKLPGRGDKLFMLATECARTLQYRDSYLLFNKNKSLYKIIASPKEKEELVAHDILPYSYRSRQIAIVTARSMFRQFGGKVINNGRRVRDDYWEAKARKQGFSEADDPRDKRPGASRAKEVAAAEALGQRQLQQYGDIVYSHDTTFGMGQPPPLPPGIAATMSYMPILEAYDAKYRDISRPRQEMTGPPYTDLTRTSTESEMLSQSTHAADYSKTINSQGRFRKSIVEDYWARPHDPPVSTPQPQVAETVNANQAYASPRFNDGDIQPQSSAMMQQPTPQTSMNPPNFPHQQNPMQSPVRQSPVGQNFMRDPSQYTPSHANFPRSSSNLSISHPTSQSQVNYASYSPHGLNNAQQAWGQPPPQPQPSPGIGNRMYGPQASPHIAQGQISSPMPSGAHSQSPHPQQQMQPSQMFQQNAGGNMGGASAQQLYGPGAGLRAMTQQQFASLGIPQAGMYNMPGGQPGHFMPGHQQQQQQQAQSFMAGGQWPQQFQ